MLLFVIISIYLIKDKPRIEKIFPFFILLFILLTSLLRIYDKCYCDLHISDNSVSLPKNIMVILFCEKLQYNYC
jgi:hypothetical protein